MKEYLLKKKIFTVIFLIVVLGFSGVNLWYSYPSLEEEIESQFYEEESFNTDELEAEISESLFGRMNFIETFGFAQVLMDKRECKNFSVIKDEKGFLHYASFFREPDNQIMEYAMRVKRLQDYAAANGTEVLFVVTPSKYDSRNVTLRTGLPVNDPTDIVNELVFDLNRLGIETLNLGEFLPNDDLSYEETFFKTDHHWTVPAAFYATQKVVEKMEDSFGTEFKEREYYMNPDNYEILTYHGGMMGSLGRRTGAVFAGVDDFTAYWPKFTGDFYRDCSAEDDEMDHSSGSFERAFMNPEVLKGKVDLYSISQNRLYLDEIRTYEKLVNNDNPDGSRIFMVRDSYFSPVMAFMMPMCREIDAIWALEETNDFDIETYIRKNEFDYIIIEVYPYNINDAAFNFFKGESDE